MILVNGRAKKAEVYPPALCRAICSGLVEQMEVDRKGQFLLAQVGIGEDQNGKELIKEVEQIKKKYRIVEEDDTTIWKRHGTTFQAQNWTQKK